MSDLNSSQSEAIEKAKEEGFKVYRSNAKCLLLDLDTAADLDYYEDRIENVVTALNMRSIEIFKKASWKSKSGKGKHIYIQITTNRALSILERMLPEVCLGSDRKRAFLSLMRYMDGNSEPECLFKPNVPEKKPKKKAVKPVPPPASTYSPEPLWSDDDVPF